VNISELFIRRPVFATVVSLILMLIGLVSYDRLSVREYPEIDEPVVTVTTTYRGASASVIEREVTQPLEDSMAGIEGIEVLSSTSRDRGKPGRRPALRWTTDPDVAASDVRDRVGRARGNLPDEIDEPIIAKVEADAQPIMYIAFKSDRMSGLEITDYLDRIVTDRLQNQPGVAQVTIFGGREYSMRIWVDRSRLAAYSLTVQDVENAVRAQNAEIPSGRIESVDREFTVLAKTALQTPEEFGNIVVKETDGFQVRLNQVARVEVAAANERRSATYNGETSISVGVIKQATANPLEVAANVRKALDDLAPTLPIGMASFVGYDTSIFIAESINSVYETIFEAVILVVLVIFVFLRTLRASFIPVVTIPISLITSFAIMLMLGFSINTLTLLAMVLAIGLVVDDAIVMLENIYRHIEEGKAPFQAAIDGSKQITFAVIAMTLTLAAVYAPVGFAEGRTGKLFLEFALTLAGTVVVSGVHRADADADALLEAASPRNEGESRSALAARAPGRARRGLQACARSGAWPSRADRRHCGSGCPFLRRSLLIVATGAGAVRRPWDAAHRRAGTARRDARVFATLCQADRNIPCRYSGSDRIPRCFRFPADHGSRLLLPARALERA